MKRLIFSEDIFHTLAQMEDKEAGLMAKAIACYAHDGTLPKWSNSILMALFSLFRKQIDMQTDSEEKRRRRADFEIINDGRQNVDCQLDKILTILF